MPDLEPALVPPRNDKKKKGKRRTQSRSSAETKRKQRDEQKSADPVSGLHLCNNGPDPDLAKRTHLSSFPPSPLNNAIHNPEPSFSQALKECQNQRVKTRSDISPRLIPLSMSKSSTGSSRSRSGTFPSPGTPNYTRYGLTSTSIQKGWSSERVPLGSTNNRGYIGSGMVLPFNHSKKLPSKWEDAEKWILSPVSGDGARQAVGPPPHHRRPKSKSGPLGHTNGYTASPAVTGSPFLAGVFIPEHGVGFSNNNDDGAGGNNGILRSVSVNGWMDTLMEATQALPPSREIKPEEKVQITREAVQRITASILTKDVSTQMSSEESTGSSPKEEASFSCPTEEINEGISRLEVRDVEIDRQVTVTRWSKKNVLRSFDKRSVGSSKSSGNWEDREKARCANKSKKEEAKITAWENLQKAKAEAEIRKLEMKLEKKRASSMERILSRLRKAQKKAGHMRQNVVTDQDQCVRKSVRKPSLFCRTGKTGLFTGCFSCHLFE